MSLETTKLLTIFTEAALESQLIHDLEKYGNPGYTITNAKGRGSRGERNATWEADANIRVEILCNEKVAYDLANYLKEQYYDNFAMVSFLTNVEVLRPNKFNEQSS